MSGLIPALLCVLMPVVLFVVLLAAPQAIRALWAALVALFSALAAPLAHAARVVTGQRPPAPDYAKLEATAFLDGMPASAALWRELAAVDERVRQPLQWRDSPAPKPPGGRACCGPTRVAPKAVALAAQAEQRVGCLACGVQAPPEIVPAHRWVCPDCWSLYPSNAHVEQDSPVAVPIADRLDADGERYERVPNLDASNGMLAYSDGERVWYRRP